MGSTPRLAALESRIGHRFANRDLLQEALTHGSVSTGGLPSFQRLEFLGDRILGLCIAIELMSRHPDDSVGDIATRFMSLVSGQTCAEVARAIDLGSAIRMSADSQKMGIRSRPALLADAMEALIAALYIDGGWEVARRVILEEWGDRLDIDIDAVKDAKSQLQELLLSAGESLPDYQVVECVGPAHSPIFTVEVTACRDLKATAKAGTKQDAEKKAAASMLKLIRA